MTEGSPNETAAGSHKKPAKAYSCIRCFERKVKCDRESPCSNCSKSNAECIFRVPPAPRRRKKRTQEEILKTRLEHYEQILKSKGIDVYQDGVKAEDLPPEGSPESSSRHLESPTSSTLPLSESLGRTSGETTMIPSRAFVSAQLIVDKNKSKFVENNLWTSLSDEFRRPSEAMPESSDEEDSDTVVDDGVDYVIGVTPSSQGVRDLHPLPEQVSTLWQIFLDNVNPLSKIIHVPTLQPAILESTSHLECLPRPFEALLFAIYSTAVLSLQDSECEDMLGESRAVLLSRYRNGTKRALARAKFLGTSDLMVLQALVLHLLAMREVYDPRTLWTLTGVAKRIAEGMGVHRDGSAMGLGPFETEMRRRLWWQITFLDFRTAELTGRGNFGNINFWDCRIPSNLNDVDIWPGMTEIPAIQERGTEMIFCLTRYELGNFWKMKMLTKDPNGDFGSVWHNFRNNASIDDKEKAIDELEHLLERKYVRFCDPSIPVEFMAILVTRAATNGMRLMTHHPRRYEKDEDVPESERTLVWTIAIKLLEIDNLIHTSKPMHRFLWHSENYFQWQALIFVLAELKKDPLNEQADRGWQRIHEIYENHPKFVTNLKLPICFAVGNLCLKAWKAREETWSRRSSSVLLRTPDYINQLRKIREERTATVTTPIPANSKQQQLDYFDQSNNAIPIQPPSQTNLAPAFESIQQTFTTLPQQIQQEQFAQQQQQGGMASQQELPAGFQFPQQQMQQPQFFWWDYQNMNDDAAIDFSMTSLPMQDTMDWTQWDLLLKDVRPSG
ncbi:hypothetical protein H2198_009197 [Neophaeococcomyces mojaviensis]|uniref:Uncharacterized protein n=1 Tax=Neophaeococcomyces mojaviensis TaxID=3383035 RepID=A0ACC2ZVE0_9EURO|nr:hypothetical protein H2198_009197 [Knufia sp. JES_112]